MKPEVILFPATLLALCTLACGGGPGGGGSSGGGSGGGGGGGGGNSGSVACLGASVVAKEANNYAFSSTLSFPPIAVAPKTELTFDWAGATADLIGHPVNPTADLNSISILMFNLPLADLQTKLNADALAQRDLVVVPLTVFPTGQTSAKLFGFTLNGNPIDAATIVSYFDAVMYPPATHTYTLAASTGKELGMGTRMLQSFVLDPASTNTNVTMTAASTKLTYTVDLHSLAPTGIPAGRSAITLDWGPLSKNALGNEFIPTNITDALVAHYTQTPVELEARFLDLDLIATDLYRASIPSGTKIDFSMMKTDAGKAFAGIDASGTWIVALRCGGCRNPAPWYLSVLKSCP